MSNFFVTPWTAARQASLSFTLSPGVCSNSCPSSQWCHPTIWSSVSRFSSCPQSFPALVSFPMSWLCIRWPKYWSFSFSISFSNEYIFPTWHPGDHCFLLLHLLHSSLLLLPHLLGLQMLGNLRAHYKISSYLLPYSLWLTLWVPNTLYTFIILECISQAWISALEHGLGVPTALSTSPLKSEKHSKLNKPKRELIISSFKSLPLP